MQLLKPTNSFSVKQKKNYISPVLSDFGKIAEITAGGSGYPDENRPTPPPGNAYGWYKKNRA